MRWPFQRCTTWRHRPGLLFECWFVPSWWSEAKGGYPKNEMLSPQVAHSGYPQQLWQHNLWRDFCIAHGGFAKSRFECAILIPGSPIWGGTRLLRFPTTQAAAICCRACTGHQALGRNTSRRHARERAHDSRGRCMQLTSKPSSRATSLCRALPGGAISQATGSSGLHAVLWNPR